MIIKETWYLLYDGQSIDAMGAPDYVGRTTSIDVARKHLQKLAADIYTTGRIDVVTDSDIHVLRRWDKL